MSNRRWTVWFVSGVLGCCMAGACGDANGTGAPSAASAAGAAGSIGAPNAGIPAGVGGSSAGVAGSTPEPSPTAGRGPTLPPPVAGASAGSGAGAGAAAAATAGMPAPSGSGGSIAAAGAPAAGSGGAGGMGGAMSAGPALPPTTDYARKGPFQTATMMNIGPGSDYTVFRPEPLGQDGFVHSPIIFGPGIITTPAQYTTLLTHLASHGFVTICANSLTGGPNAPGNLTAMEMGLEWIRAQNAEPGLFQGKLAIDRAVAMGYSIGSTASVQLSSHEAIVTTVGIHGHNTSGDPHGPVLLLTGTMDVIDDVRMTLTTLEEAPAMLAALPIGHLNVLTELGANGRYLAPITAWLRYWIHNDEAAASYFRGSDCTMCKSPWIAPETNAKWMAATTP